MIESEEEGRAFVAARADDSAMDRLDRLVDLLRSENSRQNLVSAASMEGVWCRHVADSAQLLDHVPRETEPLVWLDLGTGAGFPGLVIAAMRPAFEVIVVEPRRGRIEWLRAAVGRLGIENCTVEGVTVEALTRFDADVISARAFAPLTKLVRLAGRFSTRRTLWLLPKGRSAAQEVSALPPQWQPMFHVEQSLTDASAGIVIGRNFEGDGR